MKDRPSGKAIESDGLNQAPRHSWHTHAVIPALLNRLDQIVQAREYRFSLSLSLCLLLLLTLTAPLFAAQAGQGLIIRFQGEGRHALLESAEHVFRKGDSFSSQTADGSDSLDRIHREFGVRQIRALFRQGISGSLEAQRKRLQSRFAKARTNRRAPAMPWPDVAHIYHVQLPEGADLRKAQRAFSQDPHVAWVQQDHTHQLDALPNDPYLSSSGSWGQSFEDLWALHRIRAPEAWKISLGEGVIVAVVDTGVDYNHPDIAANIWLNEGEDLNRNGRVDPEDFNGLDDDENGFIDDIRGFDFANSLDGDGDGLYDGPLDESDSDPFDDRGHGTHIAGTIAAVGNNDLGIIGVAPKARIMPLKGFPAEGSGQDSDLWAAVLYAALNGAKVINNSWSCRPACPENPLAEEILEITQALGVVVVTSAGNGQTDAVINSPENLREAITVGASGYDDQNTASVTNFGWVVDLMAPGGGPSTNSGVRVSRRNILSLRSSGDTSPDFVVDKIYLRWAGTSMAAPHVSGVVALLKAQRPGLDPDSIRRILRQSAFDIGRPGHDYESGAGRLDALAALETTLPDLTARLDSPRNWALYAQGEEIVIAGALLGSDLDSWSVEVGLGSSPSLWQPLYSDTEPRQGELARWDTRKFEQGAYVIRLLAHSAQGQTFVEFIQISLESNSFVRLSSPGQPASAPDISFPWVVWSSARDLKDPWAEKEDQDLFLTHIRTGREKTIHKAPGDQNTASISSRRRKTILSWRSQLRGENDFEIQGCGFFARRPKCKAFTVADDSTLFSESRAMGGHIVWLQALEGRSDLLSCKVSGNGRHCKKSTLGPDREFAAGFPGGTGNTLIWTEYSNDFRFGFCQINAKTGLCPRVEINERAPSFSRPAASGNLAAWVAFTGQLSGPLRLCEVEAGTGACPWITVDRRVTDTHPQLSQHRLVWEDTAGDQDSDIYFCEYDRLRALCPVQRLTAQMGSQRAARIDDNWIVWEDDRHGSTAIYGLGLPEIKSIRVPRAREGKRLRLRVRAKDPMGEQLELAAEMASGALLEDLGIQFTQTLDASGYAKAELNWRPAAGQAGDHILTFSARKPGGLTVRKSVKITVKPAQ